MLSLLNPSRAPKLLGYKLYHFPSLVLRQANIHGAILLPLIVTRQLIV